MAKGLGFVRISILGFAHLLNRSVVIRIGGKNLEDVIDGINKKIDNASKSIDNASKGSSQLKPVEDIEALTAEQLEALRCGDIVIKQTGTEQHAYTVAYKDDTKHEISLVYCDAWNIEEVYYDKSVGGEWSMIEKKVTAIATPAE